MTFSRPLQISGLPASRPPDGPQLCRTVGVDCGGGGGLGGCWGGLSITKAAQDFSGCIVASRPKGNSRKRPSFAWPWRGYVSFIIAIARTRFFCVSSKNWRLNRSKVVVIDYSYIMLTFSFDYLRDHICNYCDKSV